MSVEVTAVTIPVECDYFYEALAGDGSPVHPRDVVEIRAHFVGKVGEDTDFRDLVPFIEASHGNRYMDAVRFIKYPVLNTIRKTRREVVLLPENLAESGFQVLLPSVIAPRKSKDASLPVWISLSEW